MSISHVFVSCAPNHTAYAIWAPAVGAVLFVAKDWLQFTLKTFCHYC